MKIIASLLAAAITCTLSGAVNIEHKQSKKGTRENNTYRIINSAPVKYSINYVINEYKGQKVVGDRSAHATGIGLNNGWYPSGSLRIIVDGKTITSPAKINCKEGIITFTWANAVLKMVFPEGSDKIYCQVKAPGAKRLQLGFLGMPGFVPKRKSPLKSYVSSAKINHFLNDGAYKTQGESWFMFYDGEFNKRGIPALILDPAAVKSGIIKGGAKMLLIVATFNIVGDNCRFMLTGVPASHMDAETLYEDLKANGNKYLKSLKEFNF